jgi:hypothetical protein
MDQKQECAESAGAVECECVWVCGRGGKRLLCQMRQQSDAEFRLEVRRNTRLYGMYHFAERVTALAFATRLRRAFESNGWSAM